MNATDALSLLLDRHEAGPDIARDAVPVALAARDLRGAAEDPAPRARRARRPGRLFLATVALPVLVAALGLYGLAADRYGSEARFILRSAGRAPVTPDAGGGIAGGSSRAGDDAYIVDDYLGSRDAFARLDADPALRDILSRPEADAFARFPALLREPTRDEMFDRYRAAVRTAVEAGTGISTVTVTAFRPGDARALAEALLGSAETVVNRLNARADRDRVAFAGDVLDRAREDLVEAGRRLTAFRTATGTVDPAREYAAALQNLGRLTAEATQREAALDQQLALTPNAPALASLRETVRAYRDEIAKANRRIAGGPDSLAARTEGYERLTLERDLAARALASAERDLDAGRKEAGRQRLYLQTVVVPNLPDVAEGPYRLPILLGVALAALALHGLLRQLKGLAEEHAE